MYVFLILLFLLILIHIVNSMKMDSFYIFLILKYLYLMCFHIVFLHFLFLILEVDLYKKVLVGLYLIFLPIHFEIYSIDILPASLQTLFKFNPLYQFITSVRSIVLYGARPSITTLIILGLIGVGTLLIGAFVFKKKQDKFIYYI